MRRDMLKLGKKSISEGTTKAFINGRGKRIQVFRSMDTTQRKYIWSLSQPTVAESNKGGRNIEEHKQGLNQHQ